MPKIRNNVGSGYFRLDTVLIREGWGRVLGPYGLGIYTVLACSADNETQECYPTYQFMAEASGMSRDQAINEMKKLVRYRLVEKVKRPNSSNVYRLLHPSLWQPPVGSQPYRLRGGVQPPGGDGPERLKLTPPSLTKPKGTSRYKFMSLEELENERDDS